MPIIDNFNMNKLNENILFNEQDIYYNKDKFDSGETNLCFITGHSGSGKSTMASTMMINDILIDVYCLDDVINNFNFTDYNLKNYGDLIYSFFETKGKKYRMGSLEELKKYDAEHGDYSESVVRDFVDYSIEYSKNHKNRKIIIEGIWLYLYIEPEKIDKFAVYIKGTSMLKSKFRAAKRKSRNFIFNAEWKYYIPDEKKINKFRNYFKKLLNK